MRRHGVGGVSVKWGMEKLEQAPPDWYWEPGWDKP